MAFFISIFIKFLLNLVIKLESKKKLFCY